MNDWLCNRSFPPLPFSHDELMVGEVDVLDTELKALGEPKAGAVEESGDEPGRSGHRAEDARHLALGENHRKLPWPPCPYRVEIAQLSAQHVPVEEEQGAQRLILRRGADLAANGEMSEKRGDLLFAHLVGVTLAVKEDVLTDPVNIGLLRPPAAVLDSQRFTDAVEKAGSFLYRSEWAHLSLGSWSLDASFRRSCRSPREDDNGVLNLARGDSRDAVLATDLARWRCRREAWGAEAPMQCGLRKIWSVSAGSTSSATVEGELEPRRLTVPAARCSPTVANRAGRGLDLRLVYAVDSELSMGSGSLSTADL